MTSNITLIITCHEELGACSATALLQIIEQVKPDVIVEELSNKLYEEAYTLKKLRTLEINAISKYVSETGVLQIPIDTYDRPKSYEADRGNLGAKLTGGARRESFELRILMDQLQDRCRLYGFSYLNSEQNDIAHNMLAAAKQKVLKKLNNPLIDELYLKDEEIIRKREDVILANVYKYASEKKFSEGLMFIGSGHRESIMKKIKEREKSSGGVITWRYFSDLNLN